MDAKRAFGLAVRDFRLQKGLSQEKFALKIDMDRTYLLLWKVAKET